MKMKVRLFMSMAAAMILAGCSNDENVVDNGPVELRLTSGITVQQTRAFTPTQSTTLESNHSVAVWVNDAGNKAELYKANLFLSVSNGGLVGGDVMYFPQTGNNVNIYAIHGYSTPDISEGTAFPTEGVEYSIYKRQTVNMESNSGYTKSDLLYACEKNVARHGNPTTKKLSFYHMLSKLEVAIKIDKGSPELAESDAVTLGSVTLNGKFTPSASATMSDQAARAAMLGAANTPQSGNITLGQQTCADFTAENVFYNEAIIVPQDMIGKVLTFKLKSGGELKYTIPAFDETPSHAVFESGKKYIYHITLNLTGLTVTSTIEPWVDEVAKEGEATMEEPEL